jgi:hypothetical protein
MLTQMAEYSFKDHHGNEFLIKGEQLRRSEIPLGLTVEDAAKCAVTTYSTESGKYVATVEYDPGEAKRGEYWAVIIPEVGQKPDVRTLDELMVELVSDANVGAFNQRTGLEDGVKKAVKELFPPPHRSPVIDQEPTVID